MPLSYATYNGNGSTTTFSVPFPYLLKEHVKVFIGFNILNGTYASQLVDGTGFNWTSGTQIQCTTAPANGQVLSVVRQTPNTAQLVDWNDGSNLIADDLDTADLQNLYIVQEQQDKTEAGAAAAIAAQTAANTATTSATTATTTANSALSTANTALSNSSAAVSTANTASTNASAAVSTANSASTNASAAVSTANAASSTATTASNNAASATSTANTAAANAATALSTANTALTNSSAAVSTANTANSNASAAVTTANTASTSASAAVTTANNANTAAASAVSTANTANTTANTALSTANTADSKANQAISAVSNSINFLLKANVAAIPASPANDTYIEVQDSSGLESFTPLAGMPVGFVGDPGLSVRLRYTSAGATWNWLNYYANNPETRYLRLAGGTVTGDIKLNAQKQLRFADADSSNYVAFQSPATVASNITWTLPDADGGANTVLSTNGSGVLGWLTPLTSGSISTSTSSTSTATVASSSAVKSAYDLADAALPKAGGTMTGAITFAAGQTFPGGTFTGAVTFAAGQTFPGGTFTGAVTFAPGQTFPGTGDVTLAGNNAMTGANSFTNSGGQVFRRAFNTDGVLLRGGAAGSGSYTVELVPATLTASRVLTLPDVNDTAAVLGTAQAFTAAQTFRAAGAVRSEAAATQDAVVLAGRAGGTSSYGVSLTPATLSANRTLTLPDVTSTVMTLAGGTMTGGITFASGQAYPQIPANSQTGAYTLVVGDAGKHINITTGGVTVPSGVFSTGDAVSIYNNSGSSQTITQGASVTLRQVGTANTGNRTLAQYGLVTILCVASNTFVISGGGLS